MKFIRKQIILTTITNEDITDIDIIKKTLESLSKSSVDFCIDFTDAQDFTITYKNARISKISDETISIIARKGKSIFNVKDIKIKNIVSIKIITDKNNIFVGKSGDFDFLDISEKDEK
jgi:hypothetical protein